MCRRRRSRSTRAPACGKQATAYSVNGEIALDKVMEMVFFAIERLADLFELRECKKKWNMND